MQEASSPSGIYNTASSFTTLLKLLLLRSHLIFSPPNLQATLQALSCQIPLFYFGNFASSLKLNALVSIILYSTGSLSLYQTVPFWSPFWPSSTDPQILVFLEVSMLSTSPPNWRQFCQAILISLMDLTTTLYQSGFGSRKFTILCMSNRKAFITGNNKPWRG